MVVPCNYMSAILLNQGFGQLSTGFSWLAGWPVFQTLVLPDAEMLSVVLLSGLGSLLARPPLLSAPLLSLLVLLLPATFSSSL